MKGRVDESRGIATLITVWKWIYHLFLLFAQYRHIFDKETDITRCDYSFSEVLLEIKPTEPLNPNRQVTWSETDQIPRSILLSKH